MKTLIAEFASIDSKSLFDDLRLHVNNNSSLNQIPTPIHQQKESFCSEKYVLDSSVDEVIRWKVSSSAHSEEDAFFVADLSVVESQFKKWKRLLPRIEPFYAVKCNPDPLVLQRMIDLGIPGFDCASKGEIDQILGLGVSSSNIIYANPCKQSSYLKYADSMNVEMMTFDNKEELYKIKKFYTNNTPQLVLRIITDDKDSVCRLSSKFGAPLETCMELLLCAKELDLDVIGVSFHVGSGCQSAKSFSDAVVSARAVFDMGIQVGYDMQILDVGGGFPGTSDAPVSFEEIAAVLGPCVDEMFPERIRVIAEPGRFFVASAFDLAVNITARRTVYDDKGNVSFMYYVNDGVYGSFNCILFDHAVVYPEVLTRNHELYSLTKEGNTLKNNLFKSSVWGPTCDSMDLINKEVMLPSLEVGDWLVYRELGAYTSTASSTFNGFQRTKIYYTDSGEQMK